MAGKSAHDRLITKLKSISELSSGDIEALRELPVTIADVDSGVDVVSEGDRSSRCCLLVEGMLGRHRSMADGRRQITSLHVSGDMPDLQSLHLKVMDHSLGALGPSTVAFVPHAALRELVERNSAIAAALWRDTLVDAAIFREWVANVGARSAYERTAHLLCEVFYKMHAVGLTQGGECSFPLSQQEMGHALGISAVHVNRTLQKLRGERLIGVQQRRLSIFDWAGLREAGEFNPSYLHVHRRAEGSAWGGDELLLGH